MMNFINEKRKGNDFFFFHRGSLNYHQEQEEAMGQNIN